MVPAKVIAPLVLASVMAVACSSPVTSESQKESWICTVAEDNHILESDGPGRLVRNGVLFLDGPGHADLVKDYPFYGLPLKVGDVMAVSEPIDLVYEKPLLCQESTRVLAK